MEMGPFSDVVDECLVVFSFSVRALPKRCDNMVLCLSVFFQNVAGLTFLFQACQCWRGSGRVVRV